MQLLVGQLEEHLAKRQESAVTAKLADFAVSDDAAELVVTSGIDKKSFSLDQTANTALSKYLKVPPAYFDKLTPDFRSTLLRYEFERNQQVDTVVEALNGQIVALHQPTKIMLPLRKVAQVIEKVFSPEDTVRRMVTNDSRFHVDVTTYDHKIIFAEAQAQLAEAGAGKSVGDVTEAGVRFLAYPFKTTQPSVNLYAERLVCTNGMTTDERLGRVSLKGRTVDEVIEEMELAAQTILGQADEYLSRLAATRNMAVPGNPQAFAAQLAREAKVSRQVLDAVLDIVNQLPSPISIWDVQNAFTSVANQVGNYSTLVRLQNLGGNLAFEAERQIERCGSCERLL